MPSQILQRWVVAIPFRQDHRPVRKLLDMPRQVAIPCYRAGDDDSVVVVEAHQTAVEGPVAELAQGQAVGGAVVVGDGPVLDVGGVHHRAAVRGDDAYAAQGAAVVVDFDDDPAESLVADRFFYCRCVGGRGFTEEFGCVGKRRELRFGQVEQGFFQFRGEAAANQVQAGRGAALREFQQVEGVLVQGGEGVAVPHVFPGGRRG